MNTPTNFTFVPLSFLALITLLGHSTQAQEEAAGASVTSSIGGNGAGTIVVEAHGQLPEPPVFFTATTNAAVKAGPEFIEQTIDVAIKVVQGKGKILSLGIAGDDQVIDVQGENLSFWSVRQAGTRRFLDLHVNNNGTDQSVVTDENIVADRNVAELNVRISTRSGKLDLKAAAAIELTHLTAGDSVGFNSTVSLEYAAGVEGVVTEATGFAPLNAGALNAGGRPSQFQTTTGGLIRLILNRSGAAPRPVELTDASLKGDVHANGDSIRFHYQANAVVTEAGAEITMLTGNAAVTTVPADAGYHLRLVTENGVPVYQLTFPEAGTFSVNLEFVASVTQPAANGRGMDFAVTAGAVVPLTLAGLSPELEFLRDQESVVPVRNGDNWLGFLPATGRVKLSWKTARQTGEGKLFFSTTGRIDSKVGAGLLHQDHLIDLQVLQGELKSIQILLQGPGEILDVQGSSVVGWNITTEGDKRLLVATLSQPVTGSGQIHIRSQTPLGAFPVTVEGLRLSPVGAIRHSGHIRLTNLGSVRLQPAELRGLTQLAPEQFPGDAVEARQSFVYRFPAADYAFTIVVDSIEPEVSVSELVVYQLAETDRVITADVELDIREAAVREWNFGVPADYSVVSVTGASVSDYILATTAADDRRNLKVMFGQDVLGRHLVTLRLEKSEAAAAGDWVLPRIEYPDAKSVRGDIGVMSAPGFRIAVGQISLLAEMPLSYFPKPSPLLQQAWRIREPGWTATMQVQLLDRSIQSDVFHLYSLSQETVYGSAIINYFVTGSPVSEWKITVPESMGNVMIDGQNVRTWRREADMLIVSLHQPVMGAYTLLVTFEEKPDKSSSTFKAGQVSPAGVQGERGYLQVVSPMQVDIETVSMSEDLLRLDPLELPAEFRLLSTAPPLGTWQYTNRPFELNLKVNWHEPGTTVGQVVEFSEANTRVSRDGELVTDVLYYIKSRGERTLKIRMPADPVRLWAVSVNGQPATARQADDATLIPLPGGADPNVPVEVSLRLGKPVVNRRRPELTLPVVFAPVLKTQWHIAGDEKHVLVPNRGTVAPPVPVLRPSGFHWVANRGVIPLFVIGLFTGIGIRARENSVFWRTVGLLSLAIAVFVCAQAASVAWSQTGPPEPLQLSLPILAAEEAVQLTVDSVPLWRANLSWTGLVAVLAGIVLTVWAVRSSTPSRQMMFVCGGVLLIALGVLFQGDGAPWFFGLLGLAILPALFLRPGFTALRDIGRWMRGISQNRNAKKDADPNSSGSDPGSASASVTSIVIFLVAAVFSTSSCIAGVPDGYEAADSLTQQWQITHQDLRLKATGSISLTGVPGTRFLLLKSPAILTRFNGDGLRLTKQEIPGEGLCYVISIPLTPVAAVTPPAPDAAPSAAPEVAPDAEQSGEQAAVPESTPEATPKAGQTAAVTFKAEFEYQLEAVSPAEGLTVLTGSAAVQEISLSYDEAGWEVSGPSVMRVEQTEETNDTTQARILLGAGPGTLFLRPKSRDVASEKTQFFAEVSNLFLPGPGVVDGRHRLSIRTSQGQLKVLSMVVPKGLTVSAVSGPVGSWQFDADSGGLTLELEPAQSQAFEILIETQRGLDPLPADVSVAPLRVIGANGEVGLVAVAFGPEARPERIEPKIMTAVNPGDFDAGLLTSSQAALHSVYRYGADGGELAVRVAPVASEVRVISKQVLSLGDERVILATNLEVEISRAGLFQLSFPLPDGLEVESLTGAALHHWAELTEDGRRKIVLHLNGRTIGTQSFSLTLSGTSPTGTDEWTVPRFELIEATRQAGELVVRPTTGIRLRTVSRKNVSETDPRTIGGSGQGALAFRLLQRDWNLVLGIETLDPWVTGQVLHEVTLREGQTRSAVIAAFNVQNASVSSLRVVLPLSDEDEIRTLRASGSAVSDMIRTAPDSNIWEIQFKRRVAGKLQFRIEYERRGDRENEEELLSPISFPQARQISYYFGVRAGGRLELNHEALTQGWQRVDWNTVPQPLRKAENRSAPSLVFRAVEPADALRVVAVRHSLADGLKLRVAQGTLTTVLSPTGDQLTSVDVNIEVIQRSSLTVSLPEAGELFSIFVNGESVNSIRHGEKSNAWQFYILPGIDDRTAAVRFVYSVAGRRLRGQRLRGLRLNSPQLNVPLENIQWNVIAPKGFELTSSDGNLELIRQSNQKDYDRDSYLSKATGNRQEQAQQATQLLEQANQLLQAGEQSKASWALNSVANQYALDAASNEDARVQLENLQTQQAIVGLNTRRQRLYLDNSREDAELTDNEQLRKAAEENPVLQQDQLNFRPQELSQLLRGNTTEDNAVLQQIAGRLVQHQHSTDPAPQAIIISLPEEGEVYTFGRSVHVAENAPLELELDFGSKFRLPLWQTVIVLVLLVGTATALASTTRRQTT